jgi:CheY-like chemotaxis protein
MRAVVVIEDATDRDTVARALQRAGISVVAVGDKANAVAAIVREAAESVVFSWALGATFVREVLSADPTGKAFLLALLDPSGAGSGISAILAAGVNDILMRPFAESELIARLQSARRAGGRPPQPPRPSGAEQQTTIDVRRLAVWKSLGDVVAADLAEMVGEFVRSTPGWPSNLGQPLRCATTVMSFPQEAAELLVSLAADPPTLTWLGAALLGDKAASDAAMDDVLRELASTAGGALKRAALQEHVAMTAGLPVTVASVRSAGESVAAFGLQCERAKVTLGLVAEVQRQYSRQVKASELREGMVVVHDVRRATGILIVPAGSRLTRTTAERLKVLLGPNSLLEVAGGPH